MKKQYESPNVTLTPLSGRSFLAGSGEGIQSDLFTDSYGETFAPVS